MNATSLNNLWVYLEGILTADDQKWLGDKLIAASYRKKDTKISTGNKEYRLSPRRKRLMASINIDPMEYEDDERAKYILSK